MTAPLYDLGQRVIFATKYGTAEDVRAALSVLAGLPLPDDAIGEAMFWAATNGRAESLHLLLATGVDHHANEEVLLYVSARRSQAASVSALLDTRTDPNMVAKLLSDDLVNEDVRSLLRSHQVHQTLESALAEEKAAGSSPLRRRRLPAVI